MTTHRPAPPSSILAAAVRPLGRRTLFRAVGVAAATTALTVGGAATQARAAVAGLTETNNIRFGDKIWDFRFRTTAMTLFEPSVRVILPNGYFSTNRRYPVLMMLHGGHIELGNNGNFLDWWRFGNIVNRTNGKDVIVICPDGGNGGFYVNWKGPQGAVVNWETFHVPQLMNWVDQRFRTIVGWKTKAVAGLSMGGYGAMTYAARNPQVFRSASAYSGPTDVFDVNQVAVMTAAPVSDGQFPGSIFQADTNMMQQWNPRFRVEGLRGLRLFMSSGDGAGGDAGSYIQESTVRRTNDAFFGDLRARGIGVDYRFLPGGQHDWANWNRFADQDIDGIVGSLPHQ